MILNKPPGDGLPESQNPSCQRIAKAQFASRLLQRALGGTTRRSTPRIRQQLGCLLCKFLPVLLLLILVLYFGTLVMTNKVDPQERSDPSRALEPLEFGMRVTRFGCKRNTNALDTLKERQRKRNKGTRGSQRTATWKAANEHRITKGKSLDLAGRPKRKPLSNSEALGQPGYIVGLGDRHPNNILMDQQRLAMCPVKGQSTENRPQNVGLLILRQAHVPSSACWCRCLALPKGSQRGTKGMGKFLHFSQTPCSPPSHAVSLDPLKWLHSEGSQGLL